MNEKVKELATKTISLVKEMGRAEELEEYIKKTFPNATEVDIDNFLWFDRYFIFVDLLGVEDSFEAVNALYY